MNNNDINSELESFRQQWREEVRARNPASSSQNSGAATASGSGRPQRPGRAAVPAPPAIGPGRRPLRSENDDDYVQAKTYDEPDATASSSGGQIAAGEGKGKEPMALETALEHYEEAVETEGQGNLGEALRLYRKAFRVGRHSSAVATGPLVSARVEA